MDQRQEVREHTRSLVAVLAQSRHRATRETDGGKAAPGRPAWISGVAYYADFVRAVDGDTLVVAWRGEAGWHTNPDRVRLAGVDAPERLPKPEPGAESARLHLQRLCSAGPLCIVPTRSWPDRYGRLIARVYDSNRRDLCSAMVIDGYAVLYRPRKRRLNLGVPAAPR